MATQAEKNIKSIAQTVHPVSGNGVDANRTGAQSNSSDWLVTQGRLTAYKDSAGGASQNVTDIDVTSGVATATCTAHGFTTGAQVTIAGATEPALNGDKVITVTGANTFTYQTSAANLTNDTGTVVATLPASWSTAKVADALGNSVLDQTVITISGHADLPDITA